MDTQENVGTEKADTSTNSNGSKLRAEAPALRTVEQLLKKNEQIQDGLERGAITPKQAEQMGQCVKTPISLARLSMAYLRLAASMGRKAPVPTNPLLRSAVGLPETVSPKDGAAVRAIGGDVE